MIKNIATGAAKKRASLKRIPATPGILAESPQPVIIRIHASRKRRNIRAREL